MQRAHGKAVFTDQRVQQRRLAGTHTAECGQVNMAVLELLQHGLHGVVVLRQRLPYAWGKAIVVDQFAQTLAGKVEVVFTTLLVSRRPLFLPGPAWQCVQRPLQYVH